MRGSVPHRCAELRALALGAEQHLGTQVLEVLQQLRGLGGKQRVVSDVCVSDNSNSNECHHH